MHRGQPFRFSVKTKVLVPVLAFLVLLPLVTVVLVDRNIREQALKEARQNLATADNVFRNSLDIRARNLGWRFGNGGNEPRYRAVAATADSATFLAFLREVFDENAEGADVMMLTSVDGKASAAVRRDTSIRMDEFARLAGPVMEIAREGEMVSDVRTVGDQIFNIVSIPVFTPRGDELLAALTFGIRLGEHEATELESLTQTEIVLVGNEHVAVTTLGREAFDPVQDATAEAVGKVREVEIGDENFLALVQEYAASVGSGSAFRYVLLSSLEARHRALAKTRFTLLGVSALGIAISGVLVWLLIHRITRPLRDLRDSAEAVGRGDFSQRIERYSDDECGDLATSFNRMTDNLQTSRADLERTVSTLRQTQEQLVQRELRLRESEEGLRLIIESARDHAIVTLDGHGRILRWNAAAERLLGYTAAEAQGLAYANLFTAGDQETGIPGHSLAAATRDGRHGFECWRLRKDGSGFWADVTLSPLPGGGIAGLAGFVEIARDVTVRKQAEQTLRDARDAAEAASRSKTEFLANMTHELRTPMNAIIGMSSLLVDRQDPTETRDCATTIRSSANALLDIIDDILDLSTIEAGRMDMAKEPLDLCGCVEQVVEQFAPRFAQKHLEFAVHFARDVPSIVLGDAVRIRQMLACLVDNGLKFTERGGVVIAVATAAFVDPKQATITFTIDDTGIGIPADRLDRLFKPFSQVDASTTRRYGGTGLGLAITRRLVELMGGTIAVESTPGRGSRFTLRLTSPIEPGPWEFSGLDGKRVALGIASPIVAEAVRAQLEAWGALVEADSSASTADARIIDVIDNGTDTIPKAGQPPVVSIAPFNLGGSAHGLNRAIRPRALHAALRGLTGTARPAARDTTFALSHPLEILVVEDNPVNARVALALLSRFGYSGHHAENGRLALEQMQRKAYDLVLMDLQMPELDGLDTTRAIRALVPASQPPYIVALTANAQKENREACFAAGMHGFMAKPLQLPMLAGVLEQAHEWIARSGSTSQLLSVPSLPRG